MRRIGLIAGFGVVLLAACGQSAPPAGKWEGGYDNGTTVVVARVEIGKDGLVKVSAPDITNFAATTAQHRRMRERLESDLAGSWDGVTPRPFDFDGKTFRKPGGFAPQMVWDKASGQMTLELYIGANPALPIMLRPVDGFHDDPWASG